MAKEQEVKLAAADASVLRAVLRDPRLAGRVEVFQMDTTYYDLGDYYKEQHWVLRLRRENGVPIVTMKTPGDDPSYRNEWECKAETPKLAVPKLIELGAPEELATIEKFQTLCSAHFTRTAVTLLRPDATVELDCDRGVLIGGCKTTPICEVELELKAGNPVALTPLRVYLTVNYNMHEEMRSKFARALALKRES